MLLDREQIMEIIPHRDPMLLVDKVVSMSQGVSIIAKFYINPSREIFRGHFPGAPVFPGVYTVECMAQTADILLLSMDRYKGTTPLFIGIDNVKFMQKIEPGDTIEIHAKLTWEKTKKAVATCSAQVYNGEALAATGDVTLAMRERGGK